MAHHVEAIEFARPVAPRHLARVFLQPGAAMRADLGALARRRLATLGVGRIYGGGQCTYADGSRYFSHRRDEVTASGQQSFQS